MNKLLFKISSFLRCRIICGPDREPYLERYHLLRLPFGIQLYLHRFVASDPGRALHNHPWQSALSLIISGQYDETRLGNSRNNYALQKRSIRVGSLNYISSKVYHRIYIPRGQQAWTLFIHSASDQTWGFLDTQNRQFSYSDHNNTLSVESNPLWWKTAPRPNSRPDMRLPLDLDLDQNLAIENN